MGRYGNSCPALIDHTSTLIEVQPYATRAFGNLGAVSGA